MNKVSKISELNREILRVKEQLHLLLGDNTIIITNEILSLSKELDELIYIWMKNYK